MESILKTSNIVKKYGDKTVLNSINMNINRGDIYGFIGKNGAGKTTFMRVVLGLTPQTSGEVKLFGEKSLKDVGLNIGALIEAPGLYKNASAYENLKRFSVLYGADESNIDELIKLVNLKKAGNRKVKDYSLGMRQRLGIAVALLKDPELLLLDEPINGLDPEGIKEVRDVIVKLNKEKNITFLISSHLLDELSKVVTRYGIINEGELIEEIEAQELKDKCRNKMVFEVDNVEKALPILKRRVSEEDITIVKKSIEVRSQIKDAGLINKELVEAGVLVSALYTNFDSLEDYFMKRIGE